MAMAMAMATTTAMRCCYSTAGAAVHSSAPRPKRMQERSRPDLFHSASRRSVLVRIASGAAPSAKEHTTEGRGRRGYMARCGKTIRRGESSVAAHEAVAGPADDGRRSFAERMKSGEQAYGCIMLSSSPVVVEILGYAGMDFVILDMEHSPVGSKELYILLLAARASGVPAVVRVPVNNEVYLKKVLDLGPDGVIIPLVDTVEQAERAGWACTYPPEGTRGVAFPLVRASKYGMDSSYLDRARADTLVLVQIESAAAVENLPEILQLQSIDGVFVGPLDLSASVGLLGQVDHTEVRQLLERIEALVPKSEKVLAGFRAGSRSASEMFSVGYNMVTGAADVALLRDAAIENVRNSMPS